MRTITLVRHGQTTGNSHRRYYGATDLPLSDLGRRQMQAAARALTGVDFDAALTSPLRRARESAAIALGDRELEAGVVEGFHEVNFGRWEGWTVDEIEARDPENYRVWRRAGPEFRFPGGDSRQEFRARIEHATRAAIAAPFVAAVWVVHKGVIRVAIDTLTGTRHPDLRIELGSIHRLESDGDRWRLLESNRVDHLGDTYQPDP